MATTAPMPAASIAAGVSCHGVAGGLSSEPSRRSESTTGMRLRASGAAIGDIGNVGRHRTIVRSGGPDRRAVGPTIR
ncbi:hypothetical protein [Mycolicibacterium setense]|uniref:hypothetical protein n=1 Tax=Mycolicibacterium setense TaxID=431269 RepID=UPI00103D147E|nr:hypothetical protein [Mycolicibacterium setense]